MVLEVAIVLANELFPENLEIYHKSFYKICDNLGRFNGLLLPRIVLIIAMYAHTFLSTDKGDL